MDLGGAEKIIGAIGSALGAILTPIGVIYVASVNGKSKAAEKSVEELSAKLDELEEELKAAKTEAEREKRSGLRWYQLVLYWFNVAHEMRRHVFDARQVAESLARQTDTAKPVWNEKLLLPHLEAPLSAEDSVGILENKP